MRPEFTPASGARNGGRPKRAGRVEQPVRPPLGDPADLRDGDGQEVAREGERRAVEVPARLHAAVGEDHRVVDRRAQLGARPPAARGRRCRAPRPSPAARSAASRRPGRDRRRSGGWPRWGRRPAGGAGCRAVGLPGLRPEGEEVGGERAVRAEQGLHGHGRADVRDAQQRGRGRASASSSMPSMPSVPLMSASPSLARSTSGSRPASRERVRRRPPGAGAVVDLALPEQRERAVGERREVAAGAERAVLRDDRREVRGEQCEQRLGHGRPRARAPHGQRAGAQQHHRPHHLALDRRRPCRRRASGSARAAARPAARRG